MKQQRVLEATGHHPHPPTLPPHSPTERSRFAARAHLVAMLGIGLVALLLRLPGLGRFVTLDEINFWIRRSHMFLEALQAGDYGGTAIWAQPGVTTMWLGSAGILLRHALLAWGVEQAAPFAAELALLRLPVALVHVAGILVGAWLLRRLLPAGVALLAALLWATDPFIIGYSRVLHVDALATTFATLSLLAACDYWYHTRQRGVLLLSAACAALAVLSKSPALAVLPVVAVVALTAPTADKRPFTPGALRVTLSTLLVWGGMFALTIVLVWPAVWAEPLRVYELFRAGVADEGAQPHPWGNFFLGRPVDAPGPLFYPVALVLRLTPWAMVGLVLLLVKRESAKHEGHTIAVLLGFVLLFTLAMSLFPKKFNRYLLPIFPALNILAAVGLARGIAWASGIGHRVSGGDARRSALGSRLLTVVVVGNALWWHPYSIAYYNPLLGGTSTGAHTFVTGWGEGLDQVAAWLNRQPDITGVVTASTMMNSLQPLMRHGAQLASPDGATLAENTGYVVVYIRQTQRGPLLPPFDQFYPEATPLHTVSIHGVAYAWIYQVVPPIAHPLDARFVAGDAAIALQGYEVASEAISSTGMLSLTLQWQAEAPLHQDYLLFVHVLDAHGQQVGQTDAPPAGADAPTSTWQPGRVIPWVHPVPVPRDLAPGSYWLSLGLYDAETFARLPLQGAAPPPAAPDDGEHALLLPLEVP